MTSLHSLKEGPAASRRAKGAKTVTYGLKSSSYLATRCLEELARQYEAEFPRAAAVIRNSMYVDDALFGGQSIKEALEVRDQLISLLQRAGFSLHKWAASDPRLLVDIPISKQHFDEHELCKENLSIKALGVTYDVKSDTLKVGCPIKNMHGDWSKRSVLSVIGSFFDPLGLVGPITVRAKEFLQKLWIENLKWDSPLPDKILKQWKQFYCQLTTMSAICVNRNIMCSNAQRVELYCYCDASQTAYGCCIYVKVIHNNSATTTLLCAKSKIAPIKNKLTVPQLELNAALILAKLYDRVRINYSNIKIDAKYMFSDSQVVLCWLKSNKNLKAYVQNRTNVIRSLTNDCNWYHIDGAFNPADCLSRGCDPAELASNTLWWNGPPQHSKPNYVPVESLVSCNHLLCSAPTYDTREVGLSVTSTVPEIPEIILKYSSWNKTVRIMTWVLRFAYNCNNKNNRLKHNLTIQELKNTENKIFNIVQNSYFVHEIHCIKNKHPIGSHLKSLTPFLDNNKVLRVSGRLQNASIPYSQKYPVILPKNCHITDLIILNEHLALLHAGPKMTMSNLALRYWIISCNREVKKILNKCVKCYRFKAQCAEQLMGSLPTDRVNQASTFSIVGIDYCGPFQVKQSSLRRSVVSKGYVIVFVCFVTKSVHLELASDMTSQCFIAALKRFISRRGLPRVIHCDNAKTFKGADNSLKELYKLHSSAQHQSTVINFASSKGIKFDYIPSYSPTFGGLWEAAVKSAKFHFKRIIGPSIFNYEEFNTIIISVEGILNSRPLTALSRDPSDLSCLTPGHFLIGRPITTIPEADCVSVPTNRLRFWRRCTQIQQSFWHVWHKQYLSLLNNRPKWHHNQPNIEEGALVLLKDERSAPLSWPLARVTKLISGPDQRVRVAEVKTSCGMSRRAINKLCILPIET
ncbi:uncharacterized protein LOC126372107 [Pectinophora gossypiella]|uniref:uncharacterized protein LOC126372107 n=1 Tax=Pectinophora gossypiella TaxID=13191 RepID=UPI00214F37CC|nr:uncharacterized protein LOC126372107 [Pectinophora gossypiella]